MASKIESIGTETISKWCAKYAEKVEKSPFGMGALIMLFIMIVVCYCCSSSSLAAYLYTKKDETVTK